MNLGGDKFIIVESLKVLLKQLIDLLETRIERNYLLLTATKFRQEVTTKDSIVRNLIPVSVGRVYGHVKCALLPYKIKYSTLSVENKTQCGTLWNIEHTFPFELIWYHMFIIYRQ